MTPAGQGEPSGAADVAERRHQPVGGGADHDHRRTPALACRQGDRRAVACIQPRQQAPTRRRREVGHLLAVGRDAGVTCRATSCSTLTPRPRARLLAPALGAGTSRPALPGGPGHDRQPPDGGHGCAAGRRAEARPRRTAASPEGGRADPGSSGIPPGRRPRPGASRSGQGRVDRGPGGAGRGNRLPATLQHRGAAMGASSAGRARDTGAGSSEAPRHLLDLIRFASLRKRHPTIGRAATSTARQKAFTASQSITMTRRCT